MFEHRNDAADDRGRDDAVANRERALDADHFPINRDRRKEIDRPDNAEGEGQGPDRDADSEAGSDQAAPFAHLKREINRGESADQTADQQGRVHFPKKDAAPETDEDRSVESVVASEQHAQEQRREGVGRDQPNGFRPEKSEGAAVAKDEEKSRRGELHEDHAEDEENAGAAHERRWLVDPELRYRRGEKEQSDDEILRGLRLLPAEDENGQTGDERREDDPFDPEGEFQGVEQFVPVDAPSRLAGSETPLHEPAAFDEVEHELLAG